MSPTRTVKPRASVPLKKSASPHSTSQNTTPSLPRPGALQQATIQRALANPGRLVPGEVLQLQRMMGNGAVGALLQRARAGREAESGLRVGPSNDAYEREAQQFAGEVGGHRLPSRSAGGATGGPVAVGSAGGTVNRKTEKKIHSAKDAGRPVPDQVRLAMEKQTGMSYRDVRVHEGKRAHEANDSLGARAFTQGKHIFLGRNQSPHNVQLMAHELTHTAQQTATAAGNHGVPSSAPGGAPGIQREDDEKKIKKLNKKIGGAKAKKGLAKFGQYALTGLDWLTTMPLRLIDQASVLDLHLKDLGNFVKTGKTRKQRAGGATVSAPFQKGSKKRKAGRTGLRAMLSGVNIHTSDLNPFFFWHGFLNPFLAMGKGQKQTQDLAKGYDKQIGNWRGQKQGLRDQMVESMVGNDQQDPMDDESMSQVVSSLLDEEETTN